MENSISRTSEPNSQPTWEHSKVRGFGRVTGLLAKPRYPHSKFLTDCLVALEEHALNFPSSSLIVSVSDGTLKARIVKR